MIKRITAADEMSSLPDSGVEAQKIRALFKAYGVKYDFCRFYCSEDFFLSDLNGSYVLSDNGCGDYAELADFLNFSGFGELFCSETSKENLIDLLPDTEIVCANLMEYTGSPAFVSVEENLSLSEIYSILATSFDIEFESWYLDMSHRIRHGISAVYKLFQSVLVVQYNLNNEALLSQIATKPEYRGKGYASRLISSVCYLLKGSRIFLLCEDELMDFYIGNGFVFREHKYQIKRNIKEVVR